MITQIPCLINEEINSDLIGVILDEDIITAAYQLGALKAPGLDGFHGKCFQHHWKEVKEAIFREVKLFFNSAKLNPELNKTFITLIPKVPNPERLDQYRSISLCNFVYKIISKVLANRLKRWLPELIATEQSAFVSGRQIQDNILIVQEVLHQLRIQKRTKKFHIVLKLDMKKAYDKWNGIFLKLALYKWGSINCGFLG